MFWSVTSILITIFGSLAALMISYPAKYLKKIPGIFKQVINVTPNTRSDLIVLFTDLSRKARREGILSLEDDIEEIEDPFLSRGLQMVVDGIEPEVIRELWNWNWYGGKRAENQRRHIPDLASWLPVSACWAP